MVSGLVKKGINAFISRQTNIFTAAFFIMLTTILSQILGVLKYRLLASIFGASSPLGVYLAAFRIPDFIFQVVIAGALSVSFIPIFTEYLSSGQKREGFKFTSSLLTLGLIFYCLVSLLIILFASPLVHLLAPGFSESELSLMVNLMIIIQLSQVFLILGTIATAYLQSFQHFLIPGIASAFYNLGIILGLLIFTQVLGFGIYGAAIGVLIGTALFFIVQIPLVISTGFSFLPSFEDSIKHSLAKLTRLMIPRSATIIVTQIAATANVYFASFIAARALVILDFAQTLAAAPVLLIGQSIAQASFPTLALKSSDKKEFLSIFVSSFNQILYLTFPISAILIVLRIPAIRLAYGAEKFDWVATVETGLTLAFFSIALMAAALLPLLSRAFYAHRDSRTPLFITMATVILNIGLSYYLILVQHLPIYYLAFSSSVSTIVAALLMLYKLNHKIGLPKVELIVSSLKIFISAVVMGVALYLPIKLLDQLVFDTTLTINLIILTGIAGGIGFVVYIFFTWLLDIREAYYVLAVLKRFSDKDKILKQIDELVEGPKP